MNFKNTIFYCVATIGVMSSFCVENLPSAAQLIRYGDRAPLPLPVQQPPSILQHDVKAVANSASICFEQGRELFEDDKFAEAVPHFIAALEQGDDAAGFYLWYIQKYRPQFFSFTKLSPHLQKKLIDGIKAAQVGDKGVHLLDESIKKARARALAGPELDRAFKQALQMVLRNKQKDNLKKREEEVKREGEEASTENECIQRERDEQHDYFVEGENVYKRLIERNNFLQEFSVFFLENGMRSLEEKRDRLTYGIFKLSGEPKAFLTIGNLIASGFIDRDEEGNLFQEQDRYKVAERFLLKLGDAQAFDTLADMYVERKLEKDEQGRLLTREERHEKAREYYLRSGDPGALFKLGWIYEDGSLKKDEQGRLLTQEERYKKAREYYLRSGSPKALFKLGWVYESGRLKKDEQGRLLTEEECYQKARECHLRSGIAYAFNSLGCMYVQGKLKKDEQGKMLTEEEQYEKAQECYLRSGSPKALFNLGRMYEEGRLKKDEKGKLLTEEQRYEKSRQCYLSSKIADAFNSLGGMYKEGKLKKNEHNKVLTQEECYEKARECLLRSGNSNALCNLGSMYYVGELKKDEQGNALTEKERYEKVREYYLRSGSPTALLNLGGMYYAGELEKDEKGNVLTEEQRYQKAREYYLRSGHAAAFNNLGCFVFSHKIHTYDGVHIKGDQERINIAIALFQRAGEYGYCSLGKVYSHLGDYHKALDYFERALKNGESETAYFIKCLKKKIKDQNLTLSNTSVLLGIDSAGAVEVLTSSSASFSSQSIAANNLSDKEVISLSLPATDQYMVEGKKDVHDEKQLEENIETVSEMEIDSDEEDENKNKQTITISKTSVPLGGNSAGAAEVLPISSSSSSSSSSSQLSVVNKVPATPVSPTVVDQSIAQEKESAYEGHTYEKEQDSKRRTDMKEDEERWLKAQENKRRLKKAKRKAFEEEQRKSFEKVLENKVLSPLGRDALFKMNNTIGDFNCVMKVKWDDEADKMMSTLALKTKKRISLLIADIKEGGRRGKPEVLTAELKGLMSRRIGDEHRLVYEIRTINDEKHLIIYSCQGHYPKDLASRRQRFHETLVEKSFKREL